MDIQVLDRNDPLRYQSDTLYLRRDRWDDYSFRTTFNASYCKTSGDAIPLGQVKIGIQGMDIHKKETSNNTTIIEPAVTFDLIPKQFAALDDTYFSLGQDERYYANISKLGDEKRVEILTALKDVAFNLTLFKNVRGEKVMVTSLLRSVNPILVREQFHRIATGGAPLTKYNFTYTVQTDHTDEPAAQLSFSVTPKSNPPTNIHVLIGRNGTGKTTLIKNMIHSIRCHDNAHGSFDYAKVGRISSHAEFSNVLCVDFSPFDDFSELDTLEATYPSRTRVKCPYCVISRCVSFSTLNSDS